MKTNLDLVNECDKYVVPIYVKYGNAKYPQLSLL